MRAISRHAAFEQSFPKNAKFLSIGIDRRYIYVYSTDQLNLRPRGLWVAASAATSNSQQQGALAPEVRNKRKKSLPQCP